MRRTALALAALMLVLAVGLAAGCGGEEEATPTPDTITGTLTTDTTETETTETTETDTETTETTETTDTEPAGGGDPAAGKEVFLGVGGCGSCHTFADAGTERLDRPEPRRRGAEPRARARPDHERAGRDALVLGSAHASSRSPTSQRTSPAPESSLARARAPL